MTRRRGPRPRARVAARGRDNTDKGAPSTSPHACADGRRSRSHAHVAARTHKDADDPDFRSAAMRTPLPQGLPVPPRLLPQRRRHPPPPAVEGAAVVLVSCHWRHLPGWPSHPVLPSPPPGTRGQRSGRPFPLRLAAARWPTDDQRCRPVAGPGRRSRSGRSRTPRR